ncbi:MAG: hypothetical protein QW112_00155 [Candidatus Micrarchaeia archaeon]
MQNKSLLFGLMVVLTCLMAPAFAVFDVNSYLYATETLDDVRSSNISYGGTLYTLYTISSRNTILVRGGEIVQDISEIRDVLKAKCFSNYPTASELDEVQSLASAYNASRNGETGMGPAEERCLVTTEHNRLL